MSLKKTVKATKQQSGNRCFSTKNALRNGFRYSRSFSKYQTSSSCPPLQPLACFSGPLWCMLGQDLAPAAEAPSKPCGRRKARSSWSAQPLGISIYRPKSACSAGQVRAMAFYSPTDFVFPSGGRAAHWNSSGMWRVLGTQALPLQFATPPPTLCF